MKRRLNIIALGLVFVFVAIGVGNAQNAAPVTQVVGDINTAIARSWSALHTFQAGILTKSLDGVTVFASQEPGSDLGAKVTTCLADANSLCDARGFTSDQTSTTQVTVPVKKDVWFGTYKYTYSGTGAAILLSGNNWVWGDGSGTTNLTVTNTSAGVFGCKPWDGVSGCDATHKISGVLLQDATLPAPASSVGNGMDLSGISNSSFNRLQLISWGTHASGTAAIFANCRTAASCLYSTFYDVTINSDSTRDGLWLQGAFNAATFVNLHVTGAGWAIVAKRNTSDNYDPNQNTFINTVAESTQTGSGTCANSGFSCGFDFENAYNWHFTGTTRCEHIVTCINAIDRTVFDIVFDNIQCPAPQGQQVVMGTSMIRISNSNCQFFDEEGYGAGAISGPNLIPNGQMSGNASGVFGWQSIDASTWPSGAFVVQATGQAIAGAYSQNVAKITNNVANAERGMATVNKIPILLPQAAVANNYPAYTLMFDYKSGTANQKLRTCFRFTDVTGATVGNGSNLGYRNSVDPATGARTSGDLTYNSFQTTNCYLRSADIQNNDTNWHSVIEIIHLPQIPATTLASVQIAFYLNTFSAGVQGDLYIANVRFCPGKCEAISTYGKSLSDTGTQQLYDTLRVVLSIADQGADCTNGELALSAGWGTTAAVTAVAGKGQTCQWTITSAGTGQAANPTVTDMLTNALPSASTACDMRMVGGTGAATLINQTTLSATAPVFTFGGTPVAASTYFVFRRCGP